MEISKRYFLIEKNTHWFCVVCLARLTRQSKPVGYDPMIDNLLGLSLTVMSWT